MSQTFHLDDIDRRILRELQRDAALSTQELGERAGCSKASCWRRIRALEEVGVLRQTVRLIDPARVGCGLDVFCHVRMRDQSIGARRAFESFIGRQEVVLECYSVTGDWDYLLHIVARDMADFEKILMGGILDHAGIANTSSTFALKRVKHTTALPV